MIIEGRYICKDAIILTPKKMKELDELFRNHYSGIKYKATTFNESNVVFESLEELLRYDNFAERRIKDIQIWGKQGHDDTALFVYIGILDGSLLNFKSTINIKYTFTTTDDEVIFLNKLKSMLQKAKAKYSWISKFNAFQLWIALLVFSFIYVIVAEGSQNIIKTYEVAFTVKQLYMDVGYNYSYYIKFYYNNSMETIVSTNSIFMERTN